VLHVHLRHALKPGAYAVQWQYASDIDRLVCFG